MDRHLDLVALLREATGIDDVEPEPRPRGDATVMLDAAIRTKSTQRLSSSATGRQPCALHLASRTEAASQGPIPDRQSPAALGFRGRAPRGVASQA